MKGRPSKPVDIALVNIVDWSCLRYPTLLSVATELDMPYMAIWEALNKHNPDGSSRCRLTYDKVLVPANMTANLNTVEGKEAILKYCFWPKGRNKENK